MSLITDIFDQEIDASNQIEQVRQELVRRRNEFSKTKSIWIEVPSSNSSQVNEAIIAWLATEGISAKKVTIGHGEPALEVYNPQWQG